MKQYKVGRYIFLSAIGLVIFGAGLVLIKLLPEADGVLKTLPYLCVGMGAGIFGGNLGIAIKNKTMLKNPQAAKQIEVEQKDERNQAISNKAKARAYDLMIYVYGAILLAFALMQVDMYVILTLVAVYLFFVFTNVHYLTKYHKEM
ncbi:MAG: hypothetical protein GYA52_05080 [Chloroflexi bacterium]|jgi:hypothetical protein|nr:hypothetical protein [Chloroflexota bacterium]